MSEFEQEGGTVVSAIRYLAKQNTSTFMSENLLLNFVSEKNTTLRQNMEMLEALLQKLK